MDGKVLASFTNLDQNSVQTPNFLNLNPRTGILYIDNLSNIPISGVIVKTFPIKIIAKSVENPSLSEFQTMTITIKNRNPCSVDNTGILSLTINT